MNFLMEGLAIGALTGGFIGLWVGYLVGVADAHRNTVIELETALQDTPEFLRSKGAA